MATSRLEPQYVDLAHQAETAELGIWGFIATEILFLGGLFAAYTFYRVQHPAGIAEAARHTKLVIGGINTLVLLTSSFVMSWASTAAEDGAVRFAGRLMRAAAGLGVVFLGLKGLEYAEEIAEHLWPGPSFALPTPQPGTAEVFYTVYWLLTGIHALHLLAGIVVVLIVARPAVRGEIARGYIAPIRVVSLYWHFVDLVWIFVFVLLYLPGRGA